MILQYTRCRFTCKVVSGRHVQNLAVNAQEMAHAQLNFKWADPFGWTNKSLWLVVHVVESFLDLQMTGHLGDFVSFTIHQEVRDQSLQRPICTSPSVIVFGILHIVIVQIVSLHAVWLVGFHNQTLVDVQWSVDRNTFSVLEFKICCKSAS